MDTANNKCLNSFLSHQRNKFIKQLIKVGVKLSKNGTFNEETFVQEFFPDKNLIIQKIKEKLKNDNGFSMNGDSKLCIDSYIFNKLREEVDTFWKDAESLRQNTETHNKDLLKQSSESIYTASDCESKDENGKKETRYSRFKDSMYNKSKRVDNKDNDTLLLSQELFPGERTDIIIQKSRINVVKNKINSHDDTVVDKFSITRH